MGKITIPDSIPVIGEVYVDDLSFDDKFIVKMETSFIPRRFLTLCATLAADKADKAVRFINISTEEHTEDVLHDIKRLRKNQVVQLPAILDHHSARITRIGRVPKKTI